VRNPLGGPSRSTIIDNEMDSLDFWFAKTSQGKLDMRSLTYFFAARNEDHELFGRGGAVVNCDGYRTGIMLRVFNNLRGG